MDLRIFTRALLIHLKSVLDKIVANDQHAFIKDRFLGNNILDLYSVVAKAIESTKGFVVFSLDIEKAFNSVRWDYLYRVLGCLQISDAFTTWIKLMNTKKELRVLNNGHASKLIKVKNGLAQGDSLSPLLFILCIELLAAEMGQNSVITGPHCGEHEKKIGLVADDTI